MEIVAEFTYGTWWLFVASAIVLIVGVATVSAGIDGQEPFFVTLGIIITLIGGLFLTQSVVIETRYEAIVDDYNEVYEQGYEIVDQRGEITIIRKVGE
ncbi:hypothetical protein [Salibacterium lacus]|uniref:Uncharacterized protein n=1 Tax=Salibacterium lacus TaxID=1898109 RepID=A0ABW5SY23_9BACI